MYYSLIIHLFCILYSLFESYSTSSLKLTRLPISLTIISTRTSVNEAGILNESITWVTQFPTESLTQADKDRFPPRDNDEQKRLCGEMMPMRACSGSVTPVQMSCGLKHMYIMEQVAANTGGTYSHFNFSLVVEDDQILPNHFLQLVVETLLQAPDSLGIVMLVG